MRYLLPLLAFTTACWRLSPEDYDAARDQDGDGSVDSTYGGPDCNPDDAEINPDADEVCDGVDNDCDGIVDEDDAADASTWFQDDDGDGYGDPAVSVPACEQPSGWVAGADDGVAFDCDDTDAGINPTTVWYADDDGDEFGWADTALTQCEQPSGYVLDSTDCDDTRDDVNPDEEELCDEVDHDCDGDDGMVDQDGDGWAICEGDCDDDSTAVNPSVSEVCNGGDDDCDGEVDEDDATDATTWYLDSDGDSYGDPSTSDVDCDQPSGWVTDNTDCDDGDAAQHPGADERCDGEDDDCDGDIDEAEALDAGPWYADTDRDSYGDSTVSDIACYQPSGFVADSTDCDDTDAAQHPGADEYCNGEDDDCDGDIDEDDALDVATWYADTDGDSYGDATVSDIECYAPSGYVADGTDCDDTAASINPGADEYCNEVDDDCDGDTDEDSAVDATTWYLDADGDGYGLDTDTLVQCEQPTSYEASGGDCDDEEAEISPAATEICDGVDNDCDGNVDYDHNVPADYGTIQMAINSALLGQRVCVLAGTYAETVWIDRDIIVEGQGSDSTTIDADGSFPAVSLINVGAGFGIRGFTITGAAGDEGVAITSNNSNAMVSDLLITDNHAVDSGQCQGALVKYSGGASAMENVEIRANTATCDQMWGQLLVYNGDLSINHLVFSGNDSWITSATSFAGLVGVSGTNVVISNAILSGNTVSTTSALDTPVLHAGLLGCTGCTMQVSNATIHGNSVDAGLGTVEGGVMFDSDGGISVVNTIISETTITGGFTASVSYGRNPITYSDIYGQDTPYFSDGTLPGSVYELDPQYTDDSAADPWDWDLTLQSGSPLIDAGDPAVSDADGTRADMGAYGGPGSDGW